MRSYIENSCEFYLNTDFFQKNDRIFSCYAIENLSTWYVYNFFLQV